tara:strand:- start:49 stop:264 length:216 start_codon:yes stop_codon:yes gene_type:complete
MVERCAEAVHKAYCDMHLKQKGTRYWTDGDYSKLGEETKDIDRATVRAVFRVLEEEGWIGLLWSGKVTPST